MTHSAQDPPVETPMTGSFPIDATSPLTFPPEPVQTSRVRYQILLISILASFMMYLDRVCLGEIVKTNQFLTDTGLNKEQIGQVMGAFFLAYALCQVPAGWLSDRFGSRKMLTLYIFAWSLLTLMTGLLTSLSALILIRMGLGVAQAGAYPTLSSTIRRWIRPTRRGLASALVSFGGRAGGTFAPFLTILLIAKLGGWQQTLWLYGVLGILVAIGYWILIRDNPLIHPRCNPQEQAHIGYFAHEKKLSLYEIGPMLVAFCGSVSLWLNCLVQFSINVGWVYLITWLPTYLKETGQVSDEVGAMMVTIVLGMGMVGQPIGGWATDWGVRRFGLRFGRALPMCFACSVAGAAYLGCLSFNSAWGVFGCCALISLMTDIGTPSTWAFMQDIGGRNTAAIFGWGNMWGNLGAAASTAMTPVLLNWGGGGEAGQQLVFLTFAGFFFLAAIAALGMNASRPLSGSGINLPE